MYDNTETRRSTAISRLTFVAVLLIGMIATAFMWIERSTGVDDDGRGTAYIVDRSDNICGISAPRSITRPTKVRYERVLAMTPQMQLAKRERVDPESARGIILRARAEELVRKTCADVQDEQHYCSVWKRIRRRDGKPIPDITPLVLAALQRPPETSPDAPPQQ